MHWYDILLLPEENHGDKAQNSRWELLHRRHFWNFAALPWRKLGRLWDDGDSVHRGTRCSTTHNPINPVMILHFEIVTYSSSLKLANPHSTLPCKQSIMPLICSSSMSFRWSWEDKQRYRLHNEHARGLWLWIIMTRNFLKEVNWCSISNRTRNA